MNPPVISRIGDRVLRTPASPVDPAVIESDAVQGLIAAMIATMRAAPGVGLAAPQIGESLRILVAEDTGAAVQALGPDRAGEMERRPFGPVVMINPEWRPVGTEMRTFFEGCLSIPGYGALVTRHRVIEVRYLDENGAGHDWTRFHGWPARILQHEADHLDGVLYTDRMIARSFMTAEAMRGEMARPIAEILGEFGALPAAARPRFG
ncbi:peptide deformylase [Pseudoxanthobacter sp.]|uniref:peptide deformylase n=1 Tax=Pseudoxanthobacter sp. TaxID=1925742 RepID=UPI002FE0C124